MGLWQQIKSGQITSEQSEIPTGAPVEDHAFSTVDDKGSDVVTGKALITRTVYQIAEMWNEVETSGGSLAWDWIFNGSRHGALIRQAEDRVNAVGSSGEHRALETACSDWLAAWRDGIDGWKGVRIATAWRPKL
ncbi:MAG: hypothetical protein LAP85_21070 [Acidobacteriia bacterium]|nr:hypothetical protein [Terriglobia bacterium]